MSNELARRAVAWKGWRWMPGWAFDGGGRMTEGMDVFGHILPDLSDDLTRLGLLVLVREAWGDPMVFAAVNADGGGNPWRVSTRAGWVGHYPTEAAALVAALEAAP